MEQTHLDLSNFKLEMSKSARGTMLSTTKLQTGTGYFSPGVFFFPMITCTADVVVFILQKRKVRPRRSWCVSKLHTQKEAGSEARLA